MKSLSSRNSYSTRRKVAFVAIIIFVLIGIGCALYLYYSRQQTTDKNKTDSTNTSAKKETAAQDDNKSSTSNSGNAGLPENSAAITSEQVPVSQDLSVTLTSTSQSDGFVKASARASGSGTCVFLYQPADQGKPVTRQTNVENNRCSVNISQNEFAYLGQWKLTVTYYSNNGKAETSQNVTIN